MLTCTILRVYYLDLMLGSRILLKYLANLQTLTTNSNSLDHYCWKKGFSLIGGDIKNIAFTTVQACKEECAETEGCVAFTTEAGTYNRCWLHNKDHGAETAKTICISVRMDCYEGKESCCI